MTRKHSKGNGNMWKGKGDENKRRDWELLHCVGDQQQRKWEFFDHEQWNSLHRWQRYQFGSFHEGTHAVMG
jgi:hypothetical protein